MNWAISWPAVLHHEETPSAWGILYAIVAWIGVGLLSSLLLPLFLDAQKVDLSAVGALGSVLGLIVVAPIAFIVGYRTAKRMKGPPPPRQ